MLLQNGQGELTSLRDSTGRVFAPLTRLSCGSFTAEPGVPCSVWRLQNNRCVTRVKVRTTRMPELKASQQNTDQCSHHLSVALMLWLIDVCIRADQKLIMVFQSTKHHQKEEGKKFWKQPSIWLSVEEASLGSSSGYPPSLVFQVQSLHRSPRSL